ncbi:MAG TPA: exonuclease SbcCD subunit D [Candidatus Limnocylindrales bacterium]|nr:exonuclease SbcCD subunit D [Candidatus Limnocylindrales bacterium]
MLRLLHTADVHLGARHADLGDGASAQRERQQAAFTAALDLAIAERVDLVLIAGDLFDSNVQPKRSVERVAADLARLKAAKIRTVILPGTHDVYDRASIYRAYDLKALAGIGVNEDWLTVLTPEQPWVHLATCHALVVGVVHDTKRAPRGALSAAIANLPDDAAATWRIGMLHGAVAIAGRTDGDEVVVSVDEIAGSGLDYLALGHWHSTQQGTAGPTTWAYSGAPEPVAVDQDRAGQVLLVTLDDASGVKQVEVEERTVGRTRFRSLELDARDVLSQPALVERLGAEADPDLVLDVRLVGVRPDELDLEPLEVEAQLRDRFFRIRVRDRSVPALTEGNLPPPDTVAGAFIRELEARIAEAEAAAAAPEAAAAAPGSTEPPDAGELRDALRLGRLLLAGHEVTL